MNAALTYEELKALSPCRESFERVTKLLGGKSGWNGNKIDAARVLPCSTRTEGSGMGRLKESLFDVGMAKIERAPADPSAERAAARTEGELIALARRRGYKAPEWWAKKVLEGRRKKR